MPNNEPQEDPTFAQKAAKVAKAVAPIAGSVLLTVGTSVLAAVVSKKVVEAMDTPTK